MTTALPPGTVARTTHALRRAAHQHPGLLPLAALGALGSALVAVGGLGAGALPEADPRAWTAAGGPVSSAVVPLGPLAATSLYYGGIAVLVAAWFGVRHHVRAVATNRWVVVAVGLVWAAPLLVAPPLASRDVYSYTAQGEVYAQGLDPYAVGPSALGDGPVSGAVDSRWADTPAPYGPLFVAVASATASLPGPQPVVSVLGLRLVMLAGLGLVAAGLPAIVRDDRRRRRTGPPRPGPAEVLVLVVLNPLVLVHLVGGVHNEALLAGLLVAGVAVATRRTPLATAAGVVLCALAAAVKAPALLGVAYVAWTASPPGTPLRRRLLVAGGWAALGLLTLDLTGRLLGLGWGWVGGLEVPGVVLSYLSVTTLSGLAVATLAHATGTGPSEAVALSTARAAGLATAAVAGAVLLWRSPRTGVGALGTSLLLVGLLGPAVQPWYLAWSLPFLAVALTGWTQRALVTACVVATVAVHPGGDVILQVLAENPQLVVLTGVVGALVGLGVGQLVRNEPVRLPRLRPG